MRVKVSDFNRHPFKSSLRPRIMTRQGRFIFIDCVETSPYEISTSANKYGIPPRVLSHKIGDEIVRVLGGTEITKKLDESDSFIQRIDLHFDGKSLILDIHLRLLIEELTCFLKIIVSN